MCKMLEDMRNEAAREAVEAAAKRMAVRMLQAGTITLEDIANYTELPLETVKELEKQSMQLV